MPYVLAIEAGTLCSLFSQRAAMPAATTLSQSELVYRNIASSWGTNSMASFNQYPGASCASFLSIVLIGVEEKGRNSVVKAISESQAGLIQEFSFYPKFDDVHWLLEQNYDAVIIDLDSNPEYVLDLVGSIHSDLSVTVMVYSARSDPGLLFRCKQVGAHEFLTLPLGPDTMMEALGRISVRREEPRFSNTETCSVVPEVSPIEQLKTHLHMAEAQPLKTQA